MEEMKKYILGDVCSRLSSGKGISSEEVFESGPYPVIGGNGLRGYSLRSNFSGECGVIGRQGAYCGNVRFFSGEAYMTEHAVVVVGNEKADTRYLTYLLSTMHLGNLSAQSAQPGLSVKTLAKQEIVLPSFPEQKRRASILASLEDKIDLNNRINHNLEEQAKHYFDEWCRGCDDEKSIAELSFNILDYSQNQRDKVILLNSSDVTEGIFEALPYVENKDLKGQFKKRFRKGDILYSEIRPRNHHYAICYFEAEDYIASTRLMIIRRNPELLSSDALLYQYLLMPRVEEEFTSKTESRSGTFPQGNYEDLSASVVPYSRENQVISDTLDSLYSIIWLNMEENKRLASFRDALLPMLMSGDLTC